MKPGCGMLFCNLPSALRIGNECVTIHTDFRTGLLIRELWQDERLVGRDALGWELTMELLFGTPLPEAVILHPEEAADAVIWYMSAGKRRMGKRSPGTKAGAQAAAPKKVFSCFWDEGLLWAAFLSEYGTDLSDPGLAGLHFWRFDALFAGLPGDGVLGQIMALRGMNPADLPDDAARASLAARQVLCRIPDAERMFAVLRGGASENV